MDSTELEWRVWIQEAFRDKSSGFSKGLVGQQDLAALSPSTRPCRQHVTCVNAESSGQTPRENGEEKETEEGVTSPVVTLLQGPQKPTWDSEAEGL